jgi:hypothetical protein
MNKDRMLMLADILDLAAVPENKPKIGFNMSAIVSGMTEDKSGHGCGTSCCIAGWALAAFGTKVEREDILGGRYPYNASERACKLLGLPDWVNTEGPHLFDAGGAPNDPRAAAATIRKMVKHNSVLPV